MIVSKRIPSAEETLRKKQTKRKTTFYLYNCIEPLSDIREKEVQRL